MKFDNEDCEFITKNNKKFGYIQTADESTANIALVSCEHNFSPYFPLKVVRHG